jgi:hypothetical protein
MMNIQPKEQDRDLDLQLSLGAMQRAAQRAREIARQTGTFLVVSRNGVVELIAPDAPDAAAASLQQPVAPYRTTPPDDGV